MKNTVALICLVGFCLFGSLKAAAVENVDGLVVEEKKSDIALTAAGEPLDPADINEDCHQPRETGRCFALFHRYAYNIESRQCEEFIYGGCAGNNNNFETKQECEIKCLPALAEASSTEVSKADEAAVATAEVVDVTTVESVESKS